MKRKSIRERISEPYSDFEDLIYGSIWSAILGILIALLVTGGQP